MKGRQLNISAGNYPNEDWELLTIIARAEGLSRQKLIQRICMDYMKKHKNSAVKMLIKRLETIK